MAEKRKRSDIVWMLRHAGLPDLADDAERRLPEEVDLEVAAHIGEGRGVTRDELISRLGGSP